MKILMVCLGNICRSPLAEAILQKKIQHAGLNWTVDSAGTNGYHVGEPPHKLSQKIAIENDLDISGQRARKFLKEDFEKFDRIYAMAEDVINEMKIIGWDKFDKSKVELLLHELYPNKNMDVPDPWSKSETEYHKAFNLIDKACDAIISKAV